MPGSKPARLRVLYLEDDLRAFELVRVLLETEDPSIDLLHAEDEPGFRVHLEQSGVDLILADFNLPAMDGLTALAIKRQHAPEVPFIFVSGSMGEDVAIESLRNGATDFVLKDSLGRLGPAVRRALAEAREHQERLEAERALRTSEERFRRLAENAPDVIFRVRLIPDLAYEYISPAVERMSGYAPTEFYRDPLFAGKITHPADRGMIQQIAATRAVPSGIREVRWLARDGRTIITEQRYVPLVDETGRVVAVEGIARDITERKQAEEQIRILSLAVEQSPVAVDITDAANRMIFANARQCELAGRSREELIGCDPRSLHSPRNARGLAAEIDRVVQSGRTWSGELLQLNRKGEDIVLRATITPIRDATGQALYSLAVKEDITATKREQERKQQLEAQLFQAQKLESIGTLAGGIAHDFNNILTGILGFAELAQLNLPVEHPVQEEIQEIQSAGLRAKELVAQILTFSRQKDSAKAPVDLARVVSEALKLLRASIPATIEIERELKPGIVLADATQIHQVVLNLCTNAAHAMGNNPGRLTLRVHEIAVDATLAAEVAGLSAGNFMRLTVQDTGTGIDEATLRRIFDPFFTTKKAGEGTGLGLSQVQGIVKAHGGAIRVRSKPGAGATFEVFLPACRETEQAAVAGGPPPKGGGQRIMVVDDETAVATFVAIRLDQLGYKADAYSDPRDALAAFLAQPELFDAVLTDLTMPHVTGLDLIRQFRDLRPDFPCLLASGYNDKLPEEVKGFSRFKTLTKPFGGEVLGHQLHALLAAGTPVAG